MKPGTVAIGIGRNIRENPEPEKSWRDSIFLTIEDLERVTGGSLKSLEPHEEGVYSDDDGNLFEEGGCRIFLVGVPKSAIPRTREVLRAHAARRDQWGIHLLSTWGHDEIVRPELIERADRRPGKSLRDRLLDVLEVLDPSGTLRNAAGLYGDHPSEGIAETQTKYGRRSPVRA